MAHMGFLRPKHNPYKSMWTLWSGLVPSLATFDISLLKAVKLSVALSMRVKYFLRVRTESPCSEEEIFNITWRL
jgi:hypothetical protein